MGLWAWVQRHQAGIMRSWYMALLLSVLMVSGCAHTTSHTGDVTDSGGKPGVQSQVLRFTAGMGAGAACISDAQTGLVWVKSPDSTTRNWDQALAYAKHLDLCGFSDWRIPGVAELQSLLNRDVPDTSAWLNDETQGFSNVHAGNYWSSETPPKRPSLGLGLNMQNGSVLGFGKAEALYAWPVRGGR